MNQLDRTLTQIESHLEKGAYTDATTELKGAVVYASSGPVAATSFVRLVRALRELAEYDKHVFGNEKTYLTAERVLAKARTLYDRDAALINEQGHLYFSQLKFEEALSEFKRVIDEKAFAEVDKAPAFQWGSACYRLTFHPSQAEELIQRLSLSLETLWRGSRLNERGCSMMRKTTTQPSVGLRVFSSAILRTNRR